MNYETNSIITEDPYVQIPPNFTMEFRKSKNCGLLKLSTSPLYGNICKCAQVHMMKVRISSQQNSTKTVHGGMECLIKGRNLTWFGLTI